MISIPNVRLEITTLRLRVICSTNWVSQISPRLFFKVFLWLFDLPCSFRPIYKPVAGRTTTRQTLLDHLYLYATQLFINFCNWPVLSPGSSSLSLLSPHLFWRNFETACLFQTEWLWVPITTFTTIWLVSSPGSPLLITLSDIIK